MHKNAQKSQTRNKSSKITIACLLLVILVLGASLVGVFARFSAKYNSDASAARIAEFNPENPFKEFSLFSKSYDNGYIQSKNEHNIVAPGASGEYKFIVDSKSNSEVEYVAKMTWTERNDLNLPIRFSLDGGVSWVDDIEKFNNVKLADGEYTLSWEWDIDNPYVTDPNGAYANAWVIINATAEFTQVTYSEANKKVVINGETMDDIAVGDKIAFPSITPAQVDKLFIGWTAKKTMVTAADLYDFNTPVTEDIVLSPVYIDLNTSSDGTLTVGNYILPADYVAAGFTADKVYAVGENFTNAHINVDLYPNCLIVCAGEGYIGGGNGSPMQIGMLYMFYQGRVYQLGLVY